MPSVRVTVSLPAEDDQPLLELVADPRDASFEELRKRVSQELALRSGDDSDGGFCVQFIDDEGDAVTVTGDLEYVDALRSGPELRLRAVPAMADSWVVPSSPLSDAPDVPPALSDSVLALELQAAAEASRSVADRVLAQAQEATRRASEASAAAQAGVLASVALAEEDAVADLVSVAPSPPGSPSASQVLSPLAPSAEAAQEQSWDELDESQIGRSVLAAAREALGEAPEPHNPSEGPWELVTPGGESDPRAQLRRFELARRRDLLLQKVEEKLKSGKEGAVAWLDRLAAPPAPPSSSAPAGAAGAAASSASSASAASAAAAGASASPQGLQRLRQAVSELLGESICLEDVQSLSSPPSSSGGASEGASGGLSAGGEESEESEEEKDGQLHESLEAPREGEGEEQAPSQAEEAAEEEGEEEKAQAEEAEEGEQAQEYEPMLWESLTEDELAVQFADQLAVLFEMGFPDVGRNVRLLQQNQGAVEPVAEELSRSA